MIMIIITINIVGVIIIIDSCGINSSISSKRNKTYPNHHIYVLNSVNHHWEYQESKKINIHGLLLLGVKPAKANQVIYWYVWLISACWDTAVGDLFISFANLMHHVSQIPSIKA